MSQKKVVKTKAQLLSKLGLFALPQSIDGLTEIMNQLAQNDVVVEGEALEMLGKAFTLLSEVPIKSFEQISTILQPLLREVDSAHGERLISLFSSVATFDLPASERTRIYEKLIDSWNEQVKQEKSIFGDLAKIAVGVVGVVVAIGAASAGYGHSRPKTMGDAANKLTDAWLKSKKR